MNPKLVLFGTLAYTLVTFPLAVSWHVLLFEDIYHSFGYFEGEPNFLLGLLSIIIQGFVLSALYPHVRLSGTSVSQGLKYSIIMGVFFWSSHVLAFVAKQVVDSSPSFVAMESVYLLMQFGIYGILIGKIYGKATEPTTQ